MSSSTSLLLANGVGWTVRSSCEVGDAVVTYLADKMWLTADRQPCRTGQTSLKICGGDGLLRVTVGGESAAYAELPRLDLSFSLPLDDITLYAMSTQVADLLVRCLECSGAILLHAAFIQRDGAGVALAAPGGTGKTTAARRVGAPWSSVCDDAVLVVRDATGQPWAHPWPTWSVIFSGKPNGTWPVESASRVAGLAFLTRGERVEVRRLGAGDAASRLTASAEQMALARWPRLTHELERAARARRFDAACALASAAPAFELTPTLHDDFWTPLGEALAEAPSTAAKAHAAPR